MINLGGTVRELPASETLARIDVDLFSRYGITRVANVTGLDNLDIPVYIAIRPNSKCLAVSQGKGLTADLAKTSAIMESIETWYAENISKDRTEITGTYKEVGAINNVAKLPFLSHEKNESRVFEWLSCLDLISERRILLPKFIFSLDTTEPTFVDGWIVTSNGLASGNSKDEASCHSLCELIERDAVASWYDKTEEEQDERLVNLETIPFKIIKNLINQVHSAGSRIFLWEITTISRVPTYYCAVANADTLNPSLFTGYGSHFDKEVAISRAITEACQARLTYISGSRDDVFPEFYQEYRPGGLLKSLSSLTPKLDVTAEKKYSPKSFSEAKQVLIEELLNKGIDQLYLFEHVSEKNIFVVHIIAPQLKECRE